MQPVTFKEAVCRLYHLKDAHYQVFVLRRSLFKRVRLVRPLVQFFHPDFLFNELRLIEKIARAHNLREVQEEVDFYQHKYVVNFFLKDALRFRLSGMRLMSLANKAFQHAANKQPEVAKPGPIRISNQKPVSP
ncbi:MAG: hypothetical protein ACP5I4_00335 [Oceanipulchritudo sp.]